MDDQVTQLKNQLRDERLKVKAQRKIIRDYELKIVELSHFANTLKDKVVRRQDEDFTNQEVSEAMIRELMKTIEDQHKIIAERDKTIMKQAKELGKYTQLDQQPLSSQEDDYILFNTDLSLNKENEPFPILDDHSIRAHTPIGPDMQPKDDSNKATTLYNKQLSEHDPIDTTAKALNIPNSQTTTSTVPNAITIIDDESTQKSEKTFQSSSSVHSKSMSEKSSGHVPFLDHQIKVKKECTNGTSTKLTQTKLIDKTNLQPTTFFEGKKRKIPHNEGYVYSEPCRSKHERAKMKGNTCTCCKGYFHDENPLKEFGTNNELSSETRIQSNSRHRTRYEPPKTPPGFWEVDFPSSFDDHFGGH